MRENTEKEQQDSILQGKFSRMAPDKYADELNDQEEHRIGYQQRDESRQHTFIPL